MFEDGVKGRGYLAPSPADADPRPCPVDSNNFIEVDEVKIEFIPEPVGTEEYFEDFEDFDLLTNWDLSAVFSPSGKAIFPDTRRGYLEHITKIATTNDLKVVVNDIGHPTGCNSLDKSILNEFFNVKGYSCVYTAKGRKSLERLKDMVDFSEWSILDFDYAKIESHPAYYDLMKALGYSDGDLMAFVRLIRFKCPNCGVNVYKAHADRYYVTAGRVHPVQLLSRNKKRAFSDYRRLLAVVHALLRHGVFNYRDGRLVRVYDKSLSLICFDLTVPSSVSLSLRDIVIQRLRESKEKFGFDLWGYVRETGVINAIYRFIFGDIVKAMKQAFIKALTEVIKLILEKEECLKVKGKLQFGGKVNCHIWSSDWLLPHFHLHTNFLNVVRVKVNGEERFVRFKPNFPEWALELLREKWTKYLKEELFKIEGAGAWLYDIDFEESFVVYSHFIELDLNENGDFVNACKILHRLRYVSRSPLLDLNIAFHEGRLIYENGEVYAVKGGHRLSIEFEWLEALAIYQNRSQCFGFVHSCKRILGVSDEELKPYKAERTEYCPICGHKMEFVESITLNELLNRGSPFVITFYHNGYRRFEFWKKKGRGG